MNEALFWLIVVGIACLVAAVDLTIPSANWERNLLEWVRKVTRDKIVKFFTKKGL